MTVRGAAADMHELTLDPGMHRYSLMERVIYGRPAEEVLPQELARIGRQRVFLVRPRSSVRRPL